MRGWVVVGGRARNAPMHARAWLSARRAAPPGLRTPAAHHATAPTHPCRRAEGGTGRPRGRDQVRQRHHDFRAQAAQVPQPARGRAEGPVRAAGRQLGEQAHALGRPVCAVHHHCSQGGRAGRAQVPAAGAHGARAGAAGGLHGGAGAEGGLRRGVWWWAAAAWRARAAAHARCPGACAHGSSRRTHAQGSKDAIDVWGHEYMRTLSGGGRAPNRMQPRCWPHLHGRVSLHLSALPRVHSNRCVAAKARH